jgi:Zn-dependent alcohol dehydrogenase
MYQLRGRRLANEGNVVKVRSDAPLERLGPLGCGIQTGAGAELRDCAEAAGAPGGGHTCSMMAVTVPILSY